MRKVSCYLKVGQRVTSTRQKTAAAKGLSDGSVTNSPIPREVQQCVGCVPFVPAEQAGVASLIINILLIPLSPPSLLKYNAPASPAEYIHRIGRTARIGCRGSSLLVLAPSEAGYVSLLASHKIKWVRNASKSFSSSSLINLPWHLQRDCALCRFLIRIY